MSRPRIVPKEQTLSSRPLSESLTAVTEFQGAAPRPARLTPSQREKARQEEIMREARDEGFREGYEEGRTLGVKEGREIGSAQIRAEMRSACEAELDEFKESLSKALKSIEFGMARWYAEAESTLGGLAVEIASRIVHQSLDVRLDLGLFVPDLRRRKSVNKGQRIIERMLY